jgi:ankyrin repeat protein
MVAAANGSKEVAKLLLEHGADVDALDSDGSALMYAVRGGRREVAVALLDAGADANARAVSSETVLLQASFRGDLDLMKMLIKNGARVNARMIDSSNALIRQCGIHADLDVIRVLLDSGADLNASRHNGETALMATAEMRNWKVAKVLLENGADVNARTNDGWTALKYATRRFPGDKGGEKEGEKEMVALLRKHGALE